MNFTNTLSSKYKITSSQGITLYHGGDLDNLKALKNEFKILSPEAKRDVPSTGGNKIGLSASIDKSIALRYSQVFGNNKVLKFILTSTANIYTVDSKGKGIDELLTNEEILTLQRKYDAIHDVGCQEKEYRILTDKCVKQMAIV